MSINTRNQYKAPNNFKKNPLDYFRNKYSTIIAAVIAWALTISDANDAEAKWSRGWARWSYSIWKTYSQPSWNKWWASIFDFFKTTPKNTVQKPLPKAVPMVPNTNLRSWSWSKLFEWATKLWRDIDVFNLMIWGAYTIQAASITESTLEKVAIEQYSQVKQKAWNNLVNEADPRYMRLKFIYDKTIAQAKKYYPETKNWNWELSLIDSPTVNAWCMPWWKIAFYTWLIEKLNLTDDEIAFVMWHEVGHALKKHWLERVRWDLMRKWAIYLVWAKYQWVVSFWLIWNSLMTLNYSRENELEADDEWVNLSQKAWFNPRAWISLFGKFKQLKSWGWMPEILSTHPTDDRRRENVEKKLANK
jgi:Zn-dependent protease with chaperone function